MMVSKILKMKFYAVPCSPKFASRLQFDVSHHQIPLRRRNTSCGSRRKMILRCSTWMLLMWDCAAMLGWSWALPMWDRGSSTAVSKCSKPTKPRDPRATNLPVWTRGCAVTSLLTWWILMVDTFWMGVLVQWRFIGVIRKSSDKIR